MYEFRNRAELKELESKVVKELNRLYELFRSLLPDATNVFYMGNVEFLVENKELFFTEINSNVAMYTQHKPFIDFEVIDRIYIEGAYDSIKFIFSTYDYEHGNPDEWLVKYLKEKYGNTCCEFVEGSINQFDPSTLYIIHSWIDDEFGKLTSDKRFAHHNFKLDILYENVQSDYYVIKEPSKDAGTGIRVVPEVDNDALSYPYIHGDRYKGRRPEVVQYFIANRHSIHSLIKNFEYFVQLMVPVVYDGTILDVHSFASYGILTHGSVIKTNTGDVSIEDIKRGDIVYTVPTYIGKFSVYPCLLNGVACWKTLEFDKMEIKGNFSTVSDVYESITCGSFVLNGRLKFAEGFQLLSRRKGSKWKFNKIESLTIGDSLLSESGKDEIITNIEYDTTKTNTYKICFENNINYTDRMIVSSGVLILDF